MSGDIEASGVGAVFVKMLREPLHRAPHLGDDAVEARGGRKRVFDQREVDPVRQDAFGEEGGAFLVVRLPIAAMDKGESWRLRVGGEKQVEPLARAITVTQIEMAL